RRRARGRLRRRDGRLRPPPTRVLRMPRRPMLRRPSRSSPPSARSRGRRPRGHSSKNGGVELAEIAARAAGENFPVGSVLFPRSLRSHIRALYCYARFVDEVGDAYEGDRLAALDEVEREVNAAFA